MYDMSTITNSLSTMQHRTPTKKTKPKKNKNNPIKVVYISNPMKVKTSASEFRALVQELTGQYAESPPDPSRYDDGVHDKIIVEEPHDHDDDSLKNNVILPTQVDDTNGQKVLLDGVSSMESIFEPFDDVFTPQMIESISAFLPDIVLCECN